MREAIMKKVQFAEAVNVDVRTVTNWEKEDGTIPSLDTIIQIASALRVSTYDVYKCFIKDPDMPFEDEDDSDEFSEPNNDNPLIAKTKTFNKDTLGLFIRFLMINTSNGGVLRCQNVSFHFSYLLLNCIDIDCEDSLFHSVVAKTTIGRESSAAMKDDNNPIMSMLRWRSVNHYFSDGCIVMDTHQNIVILNVENIHSWRISEIGYGTITFDLRVNSALFSEMETDIKDASGPALVNLSIWNYESNNQPPLHESHTRMFPVEHGKAFGAYLRAYRDRYHLSQQSLAEQLSNRSPNPHGYDKRKISKLESGKLQPSAKEFNVACAILKLPEEKLLDAYAHDYFNSTYLDDIDFSYKIGLSLSFWNVKDFQTFRSFLHDYRWAKQILGDVFGNPDICGSGSYEDTAYSHRYKEFIIYRIFDDNDNIYLYTDEGCKTIHQKTLHSIDAYNSHSNYIYEFLCKETINSEEYSYRLCFSYFMTTRSKGTK